MGEEGSTGMAEPKPPYGCRRIVARAPSHHACLISPSAMANRGSAACGATIRLEPWYYNHDRGIAVFVEDDILVTAEGRENLSRDLPRSPRGLERLMRDAGAPPGSS